MDPVDVVEELEGAGVFETVPTVDALTVLPNERDGVAVAVASVVDVPITGDTEYAGDSGMDDDGPVAPLADCVGVVVAVTIGVQEVEYDDVA